ncbi:efflux transporter, RND family, MFP subunit [Gemmatirosa kalamazoonensis]|uniref:Efflux transporter, RND family, MFP subunit n=1 Tax=Gemmatirosa kalamazoonensis TaxID=861299 RepID=W0RJC9_9BACT|nr:efflux RND transporter periplasmic adaptor subunit [Gemmatirosa kalamazoonensis]AHG90440.1 efflux transporter, RND family, MFP subunit [Gemmatirosa kalamazoonensis]
MGKPLKLSIAGVVLVGLAAVAVMGASKRDKKAVEVKIEQVGRRDLVSSVTASGQVIPHTKVDVAADISGRIVRLAVKEGDIVTQGQFLLQIEPEQYAAAVQRQEAALAGAQAQAAQAQANLIQAERAYDRMAKIKAQNANLVSESELDQLKTAADVNKALSDAAKHQVEQAVAGLRDARQALAKTTINAPMSGRVTRLNVEQGETAVPGTFNKDAATLLTISDMGVLETKVKVDETDVAHVSLGDSAVVQIDAFPDTTFVGRVTKISNSSVKGAAGQQAADQAIDFEVTIQLVNPPQETRPDFSATAKVITDARKHVLSIPIIALTVRENENVPHADSAPTMGGREPQKEVGKKDVEGVFIVAKDNKVTFRPVKVGIAGDRYFEVLGGLKEGETIVAGTYQAIRDLKDGQLVRQAVDKNAKDAKTKTATAGAKS